MKRQAEGVSCLPKEGVEQPEANGSKRIKLLKNEASADNLPMDDTEEKSMMDNSMSESSHNHNHNDLDHSPSISKNNSACEHIDATVGKDNIEYNSSQSTNENGSTEKGNFNHVASKYNGTCEEAVVKATISDSGIASELYPSHSPGNSVIYSEENQEGKGSVPPVLNHCDHDIQNSESTDSFQSEGFEAESCTQKAGNEVSGKHACQEQNNDHEKESSVESDVEKSIVDVDNLVLSHLKVTELEGHTDVVFSVAADEDYILSASADTTVKVWSTERKSTISTFSGHSNSVTSVLLLNPNQSKILKKKMSLTKVSRIAITGSLDCNIKFWSVLEGKELASVYTYNGITCLGYLESECLVVVGTEGGKLELWDIASLEVKRSERAHEDAVTDIKIKDNYIYSVSVDGTVKVWIYEDDDVYPLYTRKRKEISSDKIGFKPAQWKTVAVLEDVLYLGDSTNNIKVLAWKSGHLRLFRNQTEDQAICECVAIEKNMLFSSFYDSSSDTGGVNVWKLPEMTYVCTLTNAVAGIRSLAAAQKDNKLQIVCGGHKLCIWEFDFSRPPSSEEDEYNIHELETLGLEIDEKPVEIKSNKSATSNRDGNTSNNRWCSVM